MKIYNNIDWYKKLKLDLENIKDIALSLREGIFILQTTNSWVSKDINLCERHNHLIDMQNISCNDMEELEKRLAFLEKNRFAFSVEDLIQEFNFIKESVILQVGYFTNMVEYMGMIDDYSLQGEELTTKFEINEEISNECYYQIQMNEKELKQLKKERRDLV